MTANDVKWSLERAAEPATQAPKAELILGDILGARAKIKRVTTEIAGVHAIDDHTLSITTDTPKAYFLGKLTDPTAFVLDRENVAGNPNWFREPNGTGPFRLAEYTIGNLLRLERNESYHLDPPRLDEVHFILNVGNSELRYVKNELHVSAVTSNLDTDHPLSQELQISPPAFRISYIAMNTNMPPFDDRKVRQALNHSIDKETISQLQSRSIPANGILPAAFPGYNKDLEGVLPTQLPDAIGDDHNSDYLDFKEQPGLPFDRAIHLAS